MKLEFLKSSTMRGKKKKNDINKIFLKHVQYDLYKEGNVFVLFYHLAFKGINEARYMYIMIISFCHTVMILRFRTDMPGQTVQTQIRLLLKEQSDQGLHCLPFRQHRLDSLLYGRAT